MTTNIVLIKKPDGQTVEYHGVLYAEPGTDPEAGEEGIALQLRQCESINPRFEFIPGGQILGAWDEVSEGMCDEFLSHVDEGAVSP